MDRTQLARRISGCYIPIPTLFRDGDLELNLPGMQRHVKFLLDGGIREGNSVLLVAGGAGEFCSLSLEERLRCAEAAVEAAAGKVGVILGAQTTNQKELVALARGAERLGCLAVQAAPPFYHPPTEDDVLEWLRAISDAADVGIVFYTTYWTGFRSSKDFLGRLADLPGMVAVKWAAPHHHLFEQGLRLFADKLLFIDNQLNFVFSHILGARGINLHPSNYWPQWGLRLWEHLQAGRYAEAQAEMTKVSSPYYDLAWEICEFTGGEGHLDKLCMELIGLDGGRCRPPTRDIRDRYRDRVRQMLRRCEVPGCE